MENRTTHSNKNNDGDGNRNIQLDVVQKSSLAFPSFGVYHFYYAIGQISPVFNVAITLAMFTCFVLALWLPRDIK